MADFVSSNAKKGLGRKSLRNTLVLFNVLLIVFIVTVITYIGQNYYQSQFSKRELEQIMHLQSQVQQSFDDKLHAIEQSMDLFLKREEVWGGFANEKMGAFVDEKQRLEAETKLRQIMRDYSEVYPEYLNILVSDVDGERYYSNDSYRLDYRSFGAEEWFEDALAAPFDYRYYFHSATRNLASWKYYGENSYISLSKAVLSPETGKVFGVLLLDINLEAIKKEYSDLMGTSSAFVFFMNDAGQVLLGPDNGLAYRVRPEWFWNQTQGSMQTEIEGKMYKLFFQRSPRYDLTMVGMYDSQFLESTRQQVQFTNWMIALLGMLLATLWSLYYLSAITKPLYRLSSLMKKTEAGVLDLRFSEKCDGEIEELGQSFNQMLDRMQNLMQENRVKEKEKREAEIRILHEQLKPHFLYNTLDTIVWMGRKEGNEEIVHFTKALSNFYRIGLSKGAEYIPLERELELIRNYLDVQRVRYEGLFSYSIDCPSSLLEFPVLRMILQPLVENAIYHGFKETEPLDALLHVSVVDEGACVRIDVADNGPGLSASGLAALNAYFESGEGESVANYGLTNVHQRLHLSQGVGQCLYFSARAGGGLCVSLRLAKEAGD